MQGVTTALVAFIFFCVIFPQRVKSRPQFYAGLGLVCAIILLDALAGSIGSGFRVFAYFAVAFLQVGAILTMFMAGGGLSWSDLKQEMSGAYEVIRRGSEEKEIIVPLRGEQPKKRDQDTVDEEPPRMTIDLPEETPPAPRSPAPRRSADDASLPLE